MDNFDLCSTDNFSHDPLPSDPYFDFSSLINTAMSIERENNALIEQRFRFLSRVDGHATRTFLTAQEIIFLEFQTCEFFDNFQNCTLCVCESKSIISWLVRLINIILAKNDIIDLDFERINDSFIYYKSINMNEVRCFLNMYENNHNIVEKFFF
jgi:hypothetical protein